LAKAFAGSHRPRKVFKPIGASRSPLRREPWLTDRRMAVADRQSSDGQTDVCIVGAGPMGIALALRARRHGLTVRLVDCGGLTPRAADKRAYEVAEGKRHAPADIANCEGLGGTSWWWGGRCVPFDPIDFEARPHVRESDWPFRAEDLAPWLSDAAEFLGCGLGAFEAPLPGWAGLPGVEADRLERWSRSPRLGPHYRRALGDAGVQLDLGVKVVGLDIDFEATRVAALQVASGDGIAAIQAKHFILAAGGLGVTRLLLQAQRRHPHLFGGPGGPLGRFYMGHLSGKIADLEFSRPDDVGEFQFWRDAFQAYVRRRLTLQPDLQMRERLLNIAFWPDNSAFHDVAHGSGTLSLVYLALRMPLIGACLSPEGIRRAHVGGDASVASHLRNVARQPLRTAQELSAIIRGRFFQRPPEPSFLVRTANGNYALHYHAEHGPNEESRVSLTGDSGAPGLKVDLRFSTTDAGSVVRAHELLDEALQTAGKGRLAYRTSAKNRPQSVLDQAADGFHQIGSTRMGIDRKTSVADANCATHDLRNLFIASTSLFPTSSQANPTLLGVMLALRLADHLRQMEA
jgi:glycine/D-amino acid oxidase-like deaminating enzyme